MGLAASQARLLTITSRLSSNELRQQQLANTKMRLANDSDTISSEYSRVLNNQTLKFDDAPMEYNRLIEAGYEVKTSNGQPLAPSYIYPNRENMSDPTNSEPNMADYYSNDYKLEVTSSGVNYNNASYPYVENSKQKVSIDGYTFDVNAEYSKIGKTTNAQNVIPSLEDAVNSAKMVADFKNSNWQKGGTYIPIDSSLVRSNVTTLTGVSTAVKYETEIETETETETETSSPRRAAARASSDDLLSDFNNLAETRTFYGMEEELRDDSIVDDGLDPGPIVPKPKDPDTPQLDEDLTRAKNLFDTAIAKLRIAQQMLSDNGYTEYSNTLSNILKENHIFGGVSEVKDAGTNMYDALNSILGALNKELKDSGSVWVTKKGFNETAYNTALDHWRSDMDKWNHSEPNPDGSINDEHLIQGLLSGYLELWKDGKQVSLSSDTRIVTEYDKSDDAAAEAKYNAEIAKINRKEKMLDMQMKQLDTEYQALSSELESVKSIISNHASKDFELFS